MARAAATSRSASSRAEPGSGWDMVLPSGTRALPRRAEALDPALELLQRGVHDHLLGVLVLQRVLVREHPGVEREAHLDRVHVLVLLQHLHALHPLGPFRVARE